MHRNGNFHQNDVHYTWRVSDEVPDAFIRDQIYVLVKEVGTYHKAIMVLEGDEVKRGTWPSEVDQIITEKLSKFIPMWTDRKEVCFGQNPPLIYFRDN